jgi:hypothetical protein
MQHENGVRITAAWSVLTWSPSKRLFSHRKRSFDGVNVFLAAPAANPSARNGQINLRS